MIAQGHKPLVSVVHTLAALSSKKSFSSRCAAQSGLFELGAPTTIANVSRKRRFRGEQFGGGGSFASVSSSEWQAAENRRNLRPFQQQLVLNHTFRRRQRRITPTAHTRDNQEGRAVASCVAGLHSSPRRGVREAGPPSTHPRRYPALSCSRAPCPVDHGLVTDPFAAT